MSNSQINAVERRIENPERRRFLWRLAGTAGLAFPLLSPREDVEAGKRQQKKRRKKKRKNQRPDPQVLPDASCPGPKSNGSLLPDGRIVAQSFTAGQSGLLVRADLEIEKINDITVPGTLFLRLAPLVDAFPGTGVLASAQVAASSLAPGINVVPFNFAVPAPVQAGTSYALILSHDRSGGIAWSNRSGAACDGRSFVAFGGGAPFEVNEDFDHIFTTFVQA